MQGVDQMLNQHLTRPEEEQEVTELKATFSEVLNELEPARKYMCQFDTENSIIVMCCEVEN
jgi:hypothetical protein